MLIELFQNNTINRHSLNRKEKLNVIWGVFGRISHQFYNTHTHICIYIYEYLKYFL